MTHCCIGNTRAKELWSDISDTIFKANFTSANCSTKDSCA